MIAETTLEQLEELLGKLVAYDVGNLIHRSEWGTINFEKAQSDIESVLFVANNLSELPIEHLTDASAQRIIGAIPHTIQQLERINDFSVEAGDPSNNRDQICNELRNAAESLCAEAIQSIPYLAYRSGDFAEIVNDLEAKVSVTTEKYENAVEWFINKQDEVNQIVSATREAAASAGVATFTAEFDSEASSLKNQSKKWLFATGTIATMTIAMSVLLIYWPQVPNGVNEWESLRGIVSKLAIVVVLFTGTIWCGRIYRSLVHQAAINRHRALSLKTFQAFTKATNDPYVRDAVLMAATKSIFANVPTGLVEQVESPEQGVNFVEFGKSSGETVIEKATEG